MKRAFIVCLTLTLLALPVAAQNEAALLSRGKTYTLTTPASLAYPDEEGTKLTDGVFGAMSEGFYHKSDAYVGFNQADKDENGDFVIVLDLGSVYNNIKAFSLSYLTETDVGIYAPKSYSVYVAETEDGDYTLEGTEIINGFKDMGVSSAGSSVITADNKTQGRYIMFVIHHEEPFGSGEDTVTPGWTFIDEIAVYAAENVPQTGEGGLAALIVLSLISGSAWLGLKSKKRH